ncbi:MAG: DMT family transporter [Kiloniellales bacterium]
MSRVKHLPDHIKGLLITGIGVLVLTPDTLLVRLIASDPWTMVFWRGALTGLALTAFLTAYYGRGTAARFRAIGLPGLGIAAIFAISSPLFILALDGTSVANTLIIVSAAPLFAAIFSRVFLGEAVPGRTWGAILATVAGIAVIVSGSPRGGTLTGDMAALGTALCVAGGLTMIRRARALNMVPAIALSGFLSAALVLPLAIPFSLGTEQTGLMALLGLAILPLSFGLMTLGPRYLPAPEVGLILLLETVLGPLWVWLVLDEEPGARTLLGGAIVIAALVIHSALALRRQRAPLHG